ncbi:DNA helicase II [compost metagenome]
MKNSKSNKNQNVVTFSTFHSSKGLEFKRVYMIDLINGIMPSNDEVENSAGRNQALLEESVRLFYVGMTRAEKDLELITYRMRDGEKVIESQFVSDIRRILNPPKPEPNKESSKNNGARGSEKPSVPFNPNALKSKEDLIIGKFVKHRVFGYGKILKVNEVSIYIGFLTGIKSLSIQSIIEMGSLELADIIEQQTLF